MNRHSPPIVEFKAIPTENSRNLKCPFSNESVSFSIYPGSCIRIAGDSGAGKTTLVTFLAGLSSKKELAKLGIEVPTCAWNPAIPQGERCGVLFQQTTLLDSLTIAGNVALAIMNSPERTKTDLDEKELYSKIKYLLEAVGLNYARDASKRSTQLSGGMARRACLALQLAQNKRLIILDEPFAGLDRNSAVSVAKELVHLRVKHGTAFVLISHEPDLAALVMDAEKTKDNQVITLLPPKDKSNHDTKQFHKASLFGTTLYQRFFDDLKDFILYSLPLIMCSFLACGMAIAMLSSDILQKIDVTETVSNIIQKEVKPLIKLLTGEDPGGMTMMMINMKVKSMLNAAIPEAKAKLYAIGMAKLFVLEIGPLLTALLLCGRIGGSYAGKVATMQATAQNKLLQTLGINARCWTLLPALYAAILSSPVLTLAGTVLAIIVGAFVGDQYGICSLQIYQEEVLKTIFPPLRFNFLRNDYSEPSSIFQIIKTLDFHCTFSESYLDSLIEIVTYPPCYLFCKSIVFIVFIICVAEVSARIRNNVTPRVVPSIITTSVVVASLFCILVDWGFSRLLIMHHF